MIAKDMSQKFRWSLFGLALFAVPGQAREFSEGPTKPPVEEQILAEPGFRKVVADPTGRHVAIIGQNHWTVWELNRPTVTDGNVLLDASTYGSVADPNGSGFQSLRWSNKLSIVDVDSGALHEVACPDEFQFRFGAWSPDGRRYAFVAKLRGGEFLGYVEVVDGKRPAVKILPIPVARSGRLAFRWMPDGRRILANVDRRVAIRSSDAPRSPIGIEISDNRPESRQPNLPHKFEDPTFSLAEHRRSQLEIVDLDTGSASSPIFAAAGLDEMTPTSDGRYVLINDIRLSDGGQPTRASVVVDTSSGMEVTRLEQRGFVERIDWKPGTALLVRISGRAGAPAIEVRELDQTSWTPVSTGLPTSQSASPSTGATWLSDGRLLLTIGDNQFVHALDDVRSPWIAIPRPDTLASCSGSCLVAPAEITGTNQAWGQLLGDNDTIYETGRADRYNPLSELLVIKRSLASGRRELVWKPAERSRIYSSAIIPGRGDMIATVEESPSHPFEVMLHSRWHSIQVSSFGDRVPALAHQGALVLEYQRQDGLPLAARILLPAGYRSKRDGPLPTLIWFYPAQFESAESYGTRYPKYASEMRRPSGFLRPFSAITNANLELPMFLTAYGYAVAYMPTFPLLGVDGGPNGRYVDQSRWNAEALVAQLVNGGIADPKRVAIGGQSRAGAESLNLLVYTDLFRTAISVSGPTNFTNYLGAHQYEERNYWKAPQAFVEKSAALNADRIRESALLLQGERDELPTIVDARSMSLAMSENGANARVVVLPGENHSFYSREGLLRAMQEIHQWLDTELAFE